MRFWAWEWKLEILKCEKIIIGVFHSFRMEELYSWYKVNKKSKLLRINTNFNKTNNLRNTVSCLW